jgi:hypothetical protein
VGAAVGELEGMEVGFDVGMLLGSPVGHEV